MVGTITSPHLWPSLQATSVLLRPPERSERGLPFACRMSPMSGRTEGQATRDKLLRVDTSAPRN